MFNLILFFVKNDKFILVCLSTLEDSHYKIYDFCNEPVSVLPKMIP
ncbi:hypothetical protein VCRA2133E348_580029 [Vibrio crassostreae]|nr:hypothetical protein VCRA2133E348_580029 [Vibrio crassostreae]CAK3478791.1 hypothetical protein VCRA213O314_480001 [Vibrio crassostreae]